LGDRTGNVLADGFSGMIDDVSMLGSVARGEGAVGLLHDLLGRAEATDGVRRSGR